MNIELERKAFEAAWMAQGGTRPGNYSAEYDRYVSERVQGRYEGFKLGRANRPAQTEQRPVTVPKAWWQLIHDTLRNYRMGTLDDGYGGGYPLIDAMTADGQPVSGGIEECTYLADAIWNALYATPIAQTEQQTEQSVSAGYVLLPKQCPSLLEDVYDDQCERDGAGSTMYLPAYDAMVAALSARGTESDNRK